MRRRKPATILSRSAGVLDRLIAPGHRLVPGDMVHMLPEQETLRKLFRTFDVDCVFDVGANQGQYATMLREHVRYRGHIVSFEPIPTCAAQLRRASAGDDRWHVEEVALADIDSPGELNVMRSEQYSSLLKPDPRYRDLTQAGTTVEQVVPVKQRTIATYFDYYKHRLGFSRPFQKMDTQGNELRVAAGAGPHLAEFVGLQAELSVIPIYADVPGFDEALRFYAAKDFILSALVPNNAGHFPYLIDIDCIMSNRRYVETARDPG